MLRPTELWGALRDNGGRTMSDEFCSLDVREKAALEAALKRCCVLAAKIESELCNRKPEHFVDKLALADFYTALERAADVLGQESQKPVEDTPALTVKGLRAGGRQRHR
jgi:hypothetical protein